MQKQEMEAPSNVKFFSSLYLNFRILPSYFYLPSAFVLHVRSSLDALQILLSAQVGMGQSQGGVKLAGRALEVALFLEHEA
jgi:hypothetical protein